MDLAIPLLPMTCKEQLFGFRGTCLFFGRFSCALKMTGVVLIYNICLGAGQCTALLYQYHRLCCVEKQQES